MHTSNFNENLVNFLTQNETTFVVVTDIEGKMVWVNKGFELQTGYTKAELLGKKPGDLLQGEKTNKETILKMRNAISSKQEFKVEILNYSKNGDEYWVAIDAKPYFDTVGEVTNFIAIQHNISDTKHFEIELADSLEKLKWQNFELEDAILIAEREIALKDKIEKESYRKEELLLETQKTARIGSWEVDLIEGTVFWSEITKEIHEVPSDFVPNLEEAINFFHPDYRELITLRVNNAITKQESYDDVMLFITAKGNEIWVRAIGYPIAENDKVVKIRGIFQDVNKTKLVELELRKNENDLMESIAKMEAIINNTQSSIFALDLDYNYTAFNRNHADGVKAILGIEIYPGLNSIENVLQLFGFDNTISKVNKAIAGESFKIIENLVINGNTQFFEIFLNPIVKNDEVIGVSFYSTNITDRIKKENELIETFLKMEAIINNTQSSIYAIDSDYKYTAFNKRHANAIKELLGKDIYPGLDIKTVLYEPYKKKILSNLEKVLAGTSFSDIQDFEINGKMFYYESSLNPIIKDGNVIGATIFTSNITDRIQNETLLRNSEERFKSISSNSPFGIFLTDKEGSCIYTNERYQEIAKLTFEETLGTGWTSALHPDDKDEIFSVWNNATQSDNFYFHKSYRFLHSGNVVTWVDTTAVEIIENGILTGYLGFVQDITQNIETAEELKQTQILQRAIIDNASYAMIATDKDGLIIQFNNAAEKLLGHSADEMIGIQNPGLFHFPEQVVARTKEFSEELNIELEIGFETFVIKSKLELPNEHEWIYVHKNGNKIPVLLSITALRNSENEIYGFLGIAKDITNEKLANEQKFNALANIQSLVENTTDSIWSVDLDYKVLSLNNNAKQEFIQTYGVDLEVGMPILEYLPFELKEVWKNRYNKALAGERYTFDEYYPTENNETYLEITFNPIIAENSNVIGATIFSRNITERKKQEFQLREYSKFIESITNTSPSFVYIFDIHTFEFIFQNKDIASYLGHPISLATNINDGLWKYIYKEDSAVFFDSLPKYEDMHDQEIRVLQFRITKGDGTYAWLQTREVVFTRNDIGAPSQILVLADDITSQKEAELKLNESSERLRLATSGSGIGIWDWNLQTDLFIWDESNYKLFGIGKNEFDNTYDNFLKFVTKENKNYVAKSVNNAINKGKDFGIEYSIINTTEGSKIKQRFIRTEGKVILDSNKKVNRVIGINYDITQRRIYEENLKKAMDEAQLANRAKSSFLANMSHEIRTPMNAILGFAELLQYEKLGPKEKDYANGIISSGKSLLTLINDILDLSKIEAGKLVIKKEQTNIRNLCNDLKQVFAIKSKETGVNFQLNVNKDLPELLFIDEVRVRQILFNLVGNAVKFTHKGYVSLSVDYIKKETNNLSLDLIFEVEDTGIGIAEDQQKLIFDAFRQQDEQSTRKYGGTGLGLTITRRLAEMMHGRIELESQVNVGSKFKVCLEDTVFIQKDEAYTNKEVREATIFKFEESKILIVEDTYANQLVVKGFLKPFPELDLKIVNNGQLALEELSVNRDYDLILMDIQMPVMDGFEATSIIRTMPQMEKVPIIALTAYAMTDDLKNFEKIFDSIVTKPIVKIELLEIIAKYRAKKDLESDNNILSLSENRTKIISEANLESFRSSFKARSISYKDTIDIEAIRLLTKELKLFATDKKEDELLVLSETLEETLTSFNISKMIQILEEISKI